ncbi:MAG: hypothetical protein GY697_25445 [Desulfobacterales bacterium]|nr:hypothetical protein [Desulfobacterales bacterium]
MSFQNYEYMEGYGIAIACSNGIYIKEIEANADNAVENLLGNLSNLKDVSRFRSHKQAIKQSGLAKTKGSGLHS